MWHPLQTPAHLILLLGLAFFLGQQKQLKTVLLLPIAVFIGFLSNHFALLDWNTELILLVAALICGLLLVLKLRVPIILSLVLLACSGFVLGLDSSPIKIPGLGLNSINSWRLGATITMSLVLFLITTFAYLLNFFWNGIILRIAGSWIATSAIFVLTLIIAKVSL